MKNRIAVSLIAVSMLASGAAFAQSTTEQGAREGARTGARSVDRSAPWSAALSVLPLARPWKFPMR